MTKRIESLTKEQEDKIPQYYEKWMAIATAECPPELYDDKTSDDIKNAIMSLYKAIGRSISPDKIYMADSPFLAMLKVSALVYGKKSKTKSSVKWTGGDRITNVHIAEEFLSGFSNPKEILTKASSFRDGIYWGMSDAGFCGYVEFFQNETDVEFDFSNMSHLYILTKLTHFTVMMDKICMVAKRPMVFRNVGGKAIDDGKPYMVWGDGMGLKVK